MFGGKVGTTQFFTVGFFIVYKKRKEKNPQSAKVQQNPVLFGFIVDDLRL